MSIVFGAVCSVVVILMALMAAYVVGCVSWRVVIWVVYLVLVVGLVGQLGAIHAIVLRLVSSFLVRCDPLSCILFAIRICIL